MCRSRVTTEYLEMVSRLGTTAVPALREYRAASSGSPRVVQIPECGPDPLAGWHCLGAHSRQASETGHLGVFE